MSRLLLNRSTTLLNMAARTNNYKKKIAMERIPIVSIEGNIAAGKSTLLNFLRENMIDKFLIMKEPIDAWQNLNGSNLLSLMYEDPKKYSFLFQMYVLLTNLQQQSQESEVDVKVKIIERHVGFKYFIENSHQLGTLSDIEFSVLSEWTKYLLSSPHLNMTADLIIYLRTSPAMCFERIKKRRRNEEQSITLDYLTRLHEIHEQFIINIMKTNHPHQVMVIDVNPDLEDMTSEYNGIRKDIINYFSH